MKEEEIRPSGLFDEYLSLAERDARKYFEHSEKEDGRCPACDSSGETAFEKFGFHYEVCPRCETLFVNPRPVFSAFAKFYTESASSKFWASDFYRETATARREKLWKPKAKFIFDTLAKGHLDYNSIIDVGGGFGIFAEEFRSLTGVAPVVVEPSPALAQVCREKSLEVIQKFLEDVCPSDLPSGPRVFVCFELFEHLHDPRYFLTCLIKLMASGDIFILTTLSGTGVDIQALWSNSKSVSPPHHLNFLNPRSVKILLTRVGFGVSSITTPGSLDLDILANNINIIKDRFWHTFVKNSTDGERKKWQKVLADTGWSSHMMAVCLKP